MFCVIFRVCVTFEIIQVYALDRYSPSHQFLIAEVLRVLVVRPFFYHMKLYFVPKCTYV